MARGYMSRQDALALRWMLNFAHTIGARQETFKVSAEESATLQSSVEAFETAKTLASDPATRGLRTVFMKNEARQQAERACAALYLRIKFDRTISDDDKLSAGVRIPKPAKQHVAPPESAPLLMLMSLEPDGHILKFGLSDSSTGHAKPEGVTSMQLFRHFEDEPGVEPVLVGCFTRRPIRVNYEPRDNGRTVTYLARWMTRRGETGPWGNALRAPVVAVSATPGVVQRQAA